MNKIILAIGVPGSGKTTFVKEFAQKNDYIYICPDDIREELTGSAADQSKNREVWDEARKRLSEFLKNGKTVVFDAAFTYGEARKKFIAFAKEHGAQKVEGIFFNTPLDVIKERNQNRERKVIESELDRMNNDLSALLPTVEDGFDSVFTVDENQKLAKVTLKNEKHTINKEFKNLK